MAIIVSQIKTSLNNAENAVQKALSALGLYKNEVKTAKLHKTSVDARHGVCFVNSVYIELLKPEKEARLAEKFPNVRAFTNEELKVSFGYNQFCKRVFLSSAKLLGYNALRAFLILKKATCLRLQ